MTKFLQKRKSVRIYKEQALGQDALAFIRDKVGDIEGEENTDELNFHLFENGNLIAKGLDGLAGYAGVMIEAPHYIAVELRNNDELSTIRKGYYLERLNTELVEKGLDTCYITVSKVDDNKRKELFGEFGNYVDNILAVGHGAEDKVFSETSASPKMAVKEFVFNEYRDTPASMDLLEQRGLFEVFSSVRFAPSFKNDQPWRFILRDDHVELYMVPGNDLESNRTDIGVMMCYFELLMHLEGFRGKWTLEPKAPEQGWSFIGTFPL
ncbi:MAG: nitroreductase family protein [Tissierellia bacterium]|nr:nitroreductase family protein [Tissierellia bacterium]